MPIYLTDLFAVGMLYVIVPLALLGMLNLREHRIVNSYVEQERARTAHVTDVPDESEWRTQIVNRFDQQLRNYREFVRELEEEEQS